MAGEQIVESDGWVRCSCCGDDIPDDEEHNVDFGAVPNPHDTGSGMCVECGGDKKVEGFSEEAVKRRLGWAGRTFYEARFAVLEEKLNPNNAERFKALSYAKKVAVVVGLVERGAMI